MILKGNRVPGVIKEGPLYLNYELTVRESKTLVVVFSAVDATPARNIASYYGYHNRLNSNVLHILDDFGAHGCYLLSINNDFTIQKLVVRLIKKVLLELNVELNNVFLLAPAKVAQQRCFFHF